MQPDVLNPNMLGTDVKKIYHLNNGRIKLIFEDYCKVPNFNLLCRRGRLVICNVRWSGITNLNITSDVFVFFTDFSVNLYHTIFF